VGSPDLRIGVTEQIFHTEGKIPSSKERLKSVNRGKQLSHGNYTAVTQKRHQDREKSCFLKKKGHHGHHYD